MAEARILKALSVGCVMLLVLMGCSMFVAAKKDEEKVRCIVLFKDKVDKKLVEDCNGEITDTYDIIPGLVADMTRDDMKELKKSDKVKAVEEDAEAEILGNVDDEGKGKPGPAPTPTDWGVYKINADVVWPTNTGADIKVAVLDTGIDLDHTDLGTVYKGPDLINNDGIPDDDNGHGTHCAGIIAAQHNGIGVNGVAPDVELWAVKVLNSGGSGSYSVIISGINWAMNNHMQVISMSLSGTSASSALEAACNNAKAAGVVIVAAAGNSGNTRTQYPAAYASVISVGATDSNDAMASWSSYGSNLDLMAPGVNILSTYNNGGYSSMSGTSMACPHVAGTVALILKTGSARAKLFGDKDDIWDPDDVQDCLQKTATDMKTSGWDKYTGYGLVNAQKAVGIA